jgi:osmotically-inducible protein OsmY
LLHSTVWTYRLAALAAFGLLIATTETVAAAPAGQEIEDRDITLAVETELLLKDNVPSHLIDVATENGVVTLSGSVDTYTARLAAAETAEKVKGVIAVVNNIDVAPEERSDLQIRQDVIAALARDPATESWEVEVNVEEGVVTLDGRVDSYSEKLLAEEVAQSVKGVIAVVNNVDYEIDEDRPDEEIEADIQQRLKADASVDSRMITVSVENGKVVLSGSVGSAAEKTEAVNDAWLVAGVNAVDANNLKVEWWLSDEMEDYDTGWSDHETRQAVVDNLLYNPRVATFNVDVAVNDGVAILTGTVNNLEAKRAAEAEAEESLGVRRVKNFLRVRPGVERSDLEVANDVRDALAADPYVDRYDISVEAYNGNVHLNGEVDSWFMREEAEEAASGVVGAIEVQNNLTVDLNIPLKSDLSIKRDIEDQLWWSPFVDSDDITVSVNEGVATLFGTVEDWSELQSAKENAREGGATSVISELEIED